MSTEHGSHGGGGGGSDSALIDSGQTVFQETVGKGFSGIFAMPFLWFFFIFNTTNPMEA